MRLCQDVLEQPELVEQMRRTRLEHFAAKLTVEGLVAFEDDNVYAALGQQQPQQQARRSSTNGADVSVDSGGNIYHGGRGGHLHLLVPSTSRMPIMERLP